MNKRKELQEMGWEVGEGEMNEERRDEESWGKRQKRCGRWRHMSEWNGRWQGWAARAERNCSEEERNKRGRGTARRRRIGPYQEDSSEFPGKMDRVFMQPFPAFECLFPVLHKCVPAVEEICARYRGVTGCSAGPWGLLGSLNHLTLHHLHCLLALPSRPLLPNAP